MIPIRMNAFMPRPAVTEPAYLAAVTEQGGPGEKWQ